MIARDCTVECKWLRLLTLVILACTRPDGVPERAARAVEDTGIVARALRADAPHGSWRTVTTPHFRLHVRVGSGSERRVAMLGDSAEVARRAVLHRSVRHRQCIRQSTPSNTTRTNCPGLSAPSGVVIRPTYRR